MWVMGRRRSRSPGADLGCRYRGRRRERTPSLDQGTHEPGSTDPQRAARERARAARRRPPGEHALGAAVGRCAAAGAGGGEPPAGPRQRAHAGVAADRPLRGVHGVRGGDRDPPRGPRVHVLGDPAHDRPVPRVTARLGAVAGDRRDGRAGAEAALDTQSGLQSRAVRVREHRRARGVRAAVPHG